ncbi:hypothetical protein DFH08DRAFT_847949 [Mycena albidolilacea]|uniref:Uncharacterized protein n=1 Tax=Mycena albidolilacea TaxID=1033008 RepID=A0AAD7AGG3_9AGAR|nr:hypothetical protein DFH08DRAFT_847949 [Mycena albidolilacea]
MRSLPTVSRDLRSFFVAVLCSDSSVPYRCSTSVDWLGVEAGSGCPVALSAPPHGFIPFISRQLALPSPFTLTHPPPPIPELIPPPSFARPTQPVYHSTPPSWFLRYLGSSLSARLDVRAGNPPRTFLPCIPSRALARRPHCAQHHPHPSRLLLPYQASNYAGYGVMYGQGT